jgi:hypothetical protein
MPQHKQTVASLPIEIESWDGIASSALEVSEFVIAGWTGRDQKAMKEHIKELEAMGVSAPKQLPTYYRVAAARLTRALLIEVSGTQSSGEAEFVLAACNGQTYVGLGSDHTDRELETYGVAVSKQICDKPVSAAFWPFEEVTGHWDQLILRSYATIDGEKCLYQEGTVDAMLPPEEQIRGYCGSNQLPDGLVMFGGTIPAIGGIRSATRFEAELEDPILKRKIGFGYDLRTLPVSG